MGPVDLPLNHISQSVTGLTVAIQWPLQTWERDSLLLMQDVKQMSVHVRCLFRITQGFSLITYQDPAFKVLFLDELSKYI